MGALMRMRGVFAAAVCLVACFVVSGRAQAQQIFLEISGVQGEVVTPAAFVNQIEVLSLSWGGSKGCGTGQISMSSMNIMKNTDKASVDFALAIRDSTAFPTATLRFTRAADGQVYQSYVMNNVKIESLQTSGSSGGGPRTTESVSFVYASMSVTYTFFDGSGKAGAPETMTFAASCP